MSGDNIEGAGSKARSHGARDRWLKRLPTRGGRRLAAAFEHGSVSVEPAAPRGSDPQQPHARDEVSVAARGEDSFVDGPKRHRSGPGDILFAPAGVVHRFEAFGDDPAVWAFIYGPEGG